MVTRGGIVKFAFTGGVGLCAGLLIGLGWEWAGPHHTWRQQHAYSLGTQAAVFGFPWVLNATMRHKWVAQEPPNASTPHAALNHFWHAPTLADASYRDGGCPNNDTMYSVGWLDLRREPVILAVPDIPGGRYYSFEMMSFDGDNFAYVGTRTTGQDAGNFAITGPGWSGSLPPGVTSLPASRTPFAMILGRTLAEGPRDEAAARAIMLQYRLIPLSLWNQPRGVEPQDFSVMEPHGLREPNDIKRHPLDYWRVMNSAMSENPPTNPDHRALLDMFAEIGVGPGQDIDALDEDTRLGLARAMLNGLTLMKKMGMEGHGKKVNGWAYPPRGIGRAGLHNDFLTRGGIQSMAGLITNDAEESTYLNTTRDVDGKPLKGNAAYSIHFEPGKAPPVRAFWSLTAYDVDGNLVGNPIARYSIGDRTPGVKRDADGGLTIRLQQDTPGNDRESNWLPSPAGEITLILRAYIPEKELVEQSWVPPMVKRVD